ncbi:DUF397 domain-containing protein [Streptomyces sp. NPDC059096]|uniref:DUF397 domain-containing protein n=1 Tax=unclassified Streptomyces TaxID=2593676 RepID=UPI0036B569C4
MAALHWQKSSYSGDGNACIHVAAAPDSTIKLIESDDPDTTLTITPDKLHAFIRGVKAGEFDHLA